MSKDRLTHFQSIEGYSWPRTICIFYVRPNPATLQDFFPVLPLPLTMSSTSAEIPDFIPWGFPSL